jgi:hypothetical protein
VDIDSFEVGEIRTITTRNERYEGYYKNQSTEEQIHFFSPIDGHFRRPVETPFQSMAYTGSKTDK